MTYLLNLLACLVMTLALAAGAVVVAALVEEEDQ